MVEETCITISGRPDRLARFSTELKNNLGHGIAVHTTTLDTLYHSPVHAENLRAQVLSDIACRNISFPKFSDIIIPIRSTFTGELISEAASDRSLIDLVLDMVLTQPVHWNILVQKLSAIIPERASVRLINMGPGNGLTRSLERAIVRNIPDLLDCTVVHVAAPEFAGIKQEPIAIIGMAVNMPGASNTSQLWELLEKGLNTVSEVFNFLQSQGAPNFYLAQIPEHRFKVSDYTNGYYPGRKMKAHTGNFLQGVDEFDHKSVGHKDFLGGTLVIHHLLLGSSKLAHAKQQKWILSNEFYFTLPMKHSRIPAMFHMLRLALTLGLLDATLDPRHMIIFTICATTLMYIIAQVYMLDMFYSLEWDNSNSATGTLTAFLSGRLSYAMQLSGPSVVVDTACSSSTVALYQAARALMNLDCRAAMVGGINVISAPDVNQCAAHMRESTNAILHRCFLDWTGVIS